MDNQYSTHFQARPDALRLADIHPHRARLFFREKPYQWKSPAVDPAAEKLINDCGYHRRDQELADAKRVIFGLELIRKYNLPSRGDLRKNGFPRCHK